MEYLQKYSCSQNGESFSIECFHNLIWLGIRKSGMLKIIKNWPCKSIANKRHEWHERRRFYLQIQMFCLPSSFGSRHSAEIRIWMSWNNLQELFSTHEYGNKLAPLFSLAMTLSIFILSSWIRVSIWGITCSWTPFPALSIALSNVNCNLDWSSSLFMHQRNISRMKRKI